MINFIQALMIYIIINNFTFKYMENTFSQQTQFYKGVYDPRVIDNTTSNTLWTSESIELAIKGLSDGYKLKENPFLPNVKDVKLRRANLPFKYSDDEMFILEHSIIDKIWFCDNFGVLKDGDKGWVRINLRDYQKNLLKRYKENRWNIILFPRQSGKTTTTVLEIVHTILSSSDKDIVVIAQTDTVVGEIFTKVKQSIAGLPFFLQPGIVQLNSTDYVMVFDNGCRLKCGIAKESSVQGFSLDFLYVDEMAFISNNVVDKFWGNIYPTLVNNPNSRCIITSTPNGRNKFHTIWCDAMTKKNSFIPYRIYWYDVPGRDEDFKKLTIANMGQEWWDMGFECSFDTQLKSIFKSTIQRHLRIGQEEMETKWSMDNHLIGNIYDINFISQDVVSYNLKNDWFIISADIAEGLEQDDSVLKIKKVIYNKDLQRLEFISIGVFNDNEISVEDFAEKTLNLLKHFTSSQCRIVVENNTYGGEFFNQIKNLQLINPEKYTWFDDGVFAKFERESKKGFEKGIRWNEFNKKIAVKAFSNYVTKNILLETHYYSIEEYLNFGKNKNDTYAAQYGHDDLVMADVTLSYFLNCNNIFAKAWLDECEYYFKNYYGIDNERDRKIAEEKLKELSRYKYRDMVIRDHNENVNVDKDNILIVI